MISDNLTIIVTETRSRLDTCQDSVAATSDCESQTVLMTQEDAHFLYSFETLASQHLPTLLDVQLFGYTQPHCLLPTCIVLQ